MNSLRFVLFCGLMLTFSLLQPAKADWINKAGQIDYGSHMVIGPQGPQDERTDGMPDFDQKQDNWMNGQGQWSWCGVVATANCLWWFDSKLERVRTWSAGHNLPVRPPVVGDHYALVSAPGGFNVDDHDPASVIPFITGLGAALPGGVPPLGVTAQQIQTMIQNYLASAPVNLWGHYSVAIIERPSFDFIYAQVDSSQDQILLLGFWQDTTGHGNWCRCGGHWVTIAGASNQNGVQQLSFSDPFKDNAEAGGAGVVWNGWLLPHPANHGAGAHNDAGNVSHDWFTVQGSGSPGGGISAEGYTDYWTTSELENFIGQNFPSRLLPYRSGYHPGIPIHTEIEDLVMVCPNFDYGDLALDYPTIDIESCGPAHPLTDKAWLGSCVTAEVQPRILNLDNCDDGVQFNLLPWTPGQIVSVNVTVTTGAHYAGEALYVNAWKDGNIDGDFDDGPNRPPEVHFLNCSEWVIQDAAVAGAGVYNFQFCDPGVTNMGPYELRMRFRLTSEPVGRFGYGGLWLGGVSNGLGTHDIDWVLGEVEDYAIPLGQLAVELRTFSAVPGDRQAEVLWTTASESDNAYFSIARRSDADWTEVSHVPSIGNSSTGHNYHFLDGGLTNGLTYEYRLTAVDISGNAEILATTSVTPTAVAAPADYALEQNYPNPFNASTEIRYALKDAGHVKLTVFNATGQQVAVLVDADQSAAAHVARFDGTNLASGVYLYAISVNNFTAIRKMVLIK